ncbi:MAG: PIN domain-containing protein [Candidatus Bathyarchaeota archaeon]|nr:PIN domain-containing protein [Candidatus Bathyarchaeota archaeon]
MTRHAIDAYAWIEYLNGSTKGKKVAQILEDNNETYTCAITLGEVISKIARMNQDPKPAYDVLLSNSQIITADEELSYQAGLVHCEMRKTQKDFGLADAYILATARKLKARILTGDPHFQNIKEAILI